MSQPSPALEPLRDWFRTWEGYVRAVDFASARQLFDPNVASFGTHAEIVFGIGGLCPKFCIRPILRQHAVQFWRYGLSLSMSLEIRKTGIWKN